MIEEKIYYNNFEFFVPKKISNYCLITSHLFLIASILYFKKKEYTFSFIVFLLYIVSIFHWNYLYINSPYRIIDRLINLLVILYGCFFIFNFNITYLFLIVMLGIFWYINQIIYFYEIEFPKNYNNLNKLEERKTVPEIGYIIKNYPSDWNFSEYNNIIKMSSLTFYIINFFNIKPTYNNTQERIDAYYKSIFIHIIFVHFFGFFIMLCTIYNLL